MTLEKAISKELEEGETYSIIAHELIHDGISWSTNSSWYLSRNADKAEALNHARGRWEVFKVNYLPNGKIKDITFDGDESVIYIKADGIPFLEIRVN